MNNVKAEICNVLLMAHHNPKGKWRKVTFPVLYREIKQRAGASRDDVLRDIRYLVDAKIVSKNTERNPSVKFGDKKINGGKTDYYFLKSDVIDRLEKGESWKPVLKEIHPSVKIENSIFYAPFAIGDENNIVSYSIETDVNKVIDLIKEKITTGEEQELISIIKSDLPIVLAAPSQESAQRLMDRVKSFGQTWLIPVITQLVATYFQYKLGINN